MKRSGLIILSIAILISTLGVFTIYSSTYQKEQKQFKALYTRQIFWLILGLAAFFIVSQIDYRHFWDITYFLYIFTILLLSMVVMFGVVRLGAQRWLKVAWVNFQPSEIAKLTIVIFLARYFSKKTIDSIASAVARFKILKGVIAPFLFVIIPVGLIVGQPDLGSGAMIFIVFIMILFFSGIKLKYVFMLIGAIIASLPILWRFLLFDYQKERLLVFLDPNIDPLGAGYTIIQSKIAIGSGGLWGRGWLSGTQSQLHFLPESHTDFIFAAFSEQWGFFGSLLLLVLYYMIIRYGLLIARRTKDDFARILAFGLTAMLGTQVFINIAMNMGLAPVVGLPLPLMSYGGSSMLVTFISLGILANIDKTRTVF
ncbi:MAG: rod shape-determining protein RodA [Candidatus Omnitrophota bacterium]|nr:MAG: rod shape-determining protein RodA [Candidatus Omnitrophota bacterium]